MTIDEYLNRIPWQHRNKPKFRATLINVLNPSVEMGFLMSEIPKYYDVDEATGRQLDVIGEWVGRSRYIDTPLSGIYFEWAGTENVGWSSGIWKGRYDPASGLVSLDDDTYRLLIKLQIFANAWDGTVDGAYAAWDAIFANSDIVIEDHQNMSISIGVTGQFFSTAQKALLTQQLSPFKVAGVRIAVWFLPKVKAPLFAWGINTNNLAGWGVGAWPEKFTTQKPIRSIRGSINGN